MRLKTVRRQCKLENDGRKESAMSEFCKYCGLEFRDARMLLNNSCSMHPDGRGKHALFEGDKDGPFYCVHCGMKFSSLRMLLTNACSYNPNGRHHEAFDGRVDGEFTCKFCGRTLKDFRMMVTNACSRNPERGGHHSPAR